MRIAYLVEIDLTSESGITNKIKGQTNSWLKEGHEVKVFSFPSFGKEGGNKKVNFLDVDSESFIHPLAQKLKGQPRNYLNKVLSKRDIILSLHRFQPDIIYYRQGIWFPGIEKIFSYPAPVVVEANTNDLEEIKLEGRLRRAVYNYGRKKILQNTFGIVSVTNEISKLYEDLVPFRKTISNGYVFDEPFSPKGKSSNIQVPSLLFVGMPGYIWHGVDKILKLAELLPEFKFHLAGYEKGMLSDVPDNVVCHGILQKEELKSLYSTVNIGIGTLALHRKKMNEACPLKVREYCAFGLPMILGYIDTDLEGQDFVLNVGNFENNVIQNIDLIKNFVDAWRNVKVERKLVEPLVGFGLKERERLSFFKQIIDAYAIKFKQV